MSRAIDLFAADGGAGPARAASTRRLRTSQKLPFATASSTACSPAGCSSRPRCRGWGSASVRACSGRAEGSLRRGYFESNLEELWALIERLRAA